MTEIVKKKSAQTPKTEESKLLQDIRSLITAARSSAVRNIDRLQVITNFKIGRRIVEEEQKGAARAEYGKRIIPELRRQFDSGLYERLALSRDKASIKALSKEGQIIAGPRDIIKHPYVLEFLGIDEKAQFSETDFERAIINKIEHFLLELGKGFLFEARQKRFTFNEEHFFVDLVFYNRLLRSYVLIDLKIGKLTHQNLGQMQMYVNYFDRFVKRNDENSTIGIILCRKKNEALVEITLPKDANIHASEYQLYLPSKDELRQKLMDWTKELG
jgi:predicted nuclease of restriction endonuclease-like (RecB) superfamily